MKISQQLLRNSLKASKSWKVPSKTENGKWHEVVLSNGKLICNCTAGLMGKDCSHKQIILWNSNLMDTI